jgi:hypothetical protein
LEDVSFFGWGVESSTPSLTCSAAGEEGGKGGEGSFLFSIIFGRRTVSELDSHISVSAAFTLVGCA